jgi:anti-sigma regulatory factor (Ser/Thr protein kinase)
MIDSGSSSPQPPAAAHISDRVGIPSVTAGIALDAVAASARSARRFVGRALDDAHVERAVFDTVVLLTSEVVTNAVLHARSPIELTVEIGSHAVRVQVCDEFPGLRDEPDRSRHGGRGLVLVAAMASQWGISPSGDAPGKSVWFDVVRPTLPHGR